MFALMFLTLFFLYYFYAYECTLLYKHSCYRLPVWEFGAARHAYHIGLAHNPRATYISYQAMVQDKEVLGIRPRTNTSIGRKANTGASSFMLPGMFSEDAANSVFVRQTLGIRLRSVKGFGCE